MSSSEDSVRILLKALESMKYYSSLYELEKESGYRLRSYGKEIDFFYEIVMEGRFEDIDTFITPLLTCNQASYNKVSFSVRKQNFSESWKFPLTPNWTIS